MAWLPDSENVDCIFSHFNKHQHVTDGGKRFKSYCVDKRTHQQTHTTENNTTFTVPVVITVKSLLLIVLMHADNDELLSTSRGSGGARILLLFSLGTFNWTTLKSILTTTCRRSPAAVRVASVRIQIDERAASTSQTSETTSSSCRRAAASTEHA